MRKFMRLYHNNVRGAQLWQVIRRSDYTSDLTNDEVSVVYKKYKDAADAADSFLRLGRQEKPTLSSIPINPYLEVPNRITDRVSYVIKVKASFLGEDSFHERIITVTSPWTLSRAELSERLGNYFRRVAYTESGKLGSDAGTPVDFASIEYLGIVRKW